MCGIIGYCGEEPAAPLVLEALKRLEYRGYDSAGMASLHDGRLLVRKDTGRIDQVDAKHHLETLPGGTAIGHTRWATHGAVTQANAHPHSDCRDRVSVVHNGIIENYEELRRELTARGHRLSSDTDTEVIPHLIGEELGNGASLEQAVLAVARRLKGSYAFAAISLDDPEKIVAARRNNPLVVGVSDHGRWVSSDVLAFPRSTRGVMDLEDTEVVALRSDEVQVFDASGNKLARETREWNRIWADGEKNGYPHFMLKEIMEQPAALAKTAQQYESEFSEIALDVLRANQVVITACGTSRYAGLVGRYLFSRVARKFSDVVMASEFGYFVDSVGKNTLVIAVSQSGETADVVEGVKAARAAGAEIVSIVNRPHSLLAGLSHRVINLNCGSEIGVAATKSFLSELVVFYLLSFSMVDSFGAARRRVGDICDRVAEALSSNNNGLIHLSRRLKDRNDFYYIARGINFAIASEGALKLKEISYIHAEGMPAGELKHGTLALIEPGTPVVAVCPADRTYYETMNNVMEAKARGAYVIGVSDRESDIYDFWIRIPPVDELLYPMVGVVPLQLLAYHLAVARGCDPDKPRNLAKSVTVK